MGPVVKCNAVPQAQRANSVWPLAYTFCLDAEPTQAQWDAAKAAWAKQAAGDKAAAAKKAADEAKKAAAAAAAGAAAAAKVRRANARDGCCCCHTVMTTQGPSTINSVRQPVRCTGMLPALCCSQQMPCLVCCRARGVRARARTS
jgi:hypothetical protein